MSESTDPWEILRGWFPDLNEEAWEKLKEYCDLLANGTLRLT